MNSASSGQVSDAVLREHCRQVVEGLLHGRVTPFLGAGVNLVGRPAERRFMPGALLPSGAELAQYLAERFRVPE